MTINIAFNLWLYVCCNLQHLYIYISNVAWHILHFVIGNCMISYIIYTLHYTLSIILCLIMLYYRISYYLYNIALYHNINCKIYHTLWYDRILYIYIYNLVSVPLCCLILARLDCETILTYCTTWSYNITGF